MGKNQKVLLTFTGFHDPYFMSLIEDRELPGPIISLLNEVSFQSVVLFATPQTRQISLDTNAAIFESFPNTRVNVIEMDLPDPTDYYRILKELKPHICKIIDDHSSADFFISVASGTPQMHACWVLLTASGELPATILHVIPPRFVSASRPMVSKVNLSHKEFPTVRFLDTDVTTDYFEQDVNAVRRRLGIIGDHDSILKPIEMSANMAKSSSPILITGESGTGKELFAELIHALSQRHSKPFITVNCSTIPELLAESHLFGHRKGSFSGATESKVGVFEAADNGTLFLDEIGEMPLNIQPKLLRILENGEYTPVGATKPRKIDVRIIAATNRNLEKMVGKSTFRRDLYFRLKVLSVELPPLRDRRSDIPKIAQCMLDKLNSRVKPNKKLSQSALIRLRNHNWAGNVRELRNVIESTMILCRDEVIYADDLIFDNSVGYADPLNNLPTPYEGFSIKGFLKSAKKQLYLKALDLSGGNLTKAAKMLDVTPQAVKNFLSRKGNDV